MNQRYLKEKRIMKCKIFEAKNLNVFKKLLRILAEYTKNVPDTGTGRLFDLAVKNGMKILPKDKTALAILDHVLDEDAIPESMQKLLNMRFDNLPVDCRPINKSGEKHETAVWTMNDFISDRVNDLINCENVGGTGNWCNKEGEKVSLIDMLEESES